MSILLHATIRRNLPSIWKLGISPAFSQVRVPSAGSAPAPAGPGRSSTSPTGTTCRSRRWSSSASPSPAPGWSALPRGVDLRHGRQVHPLRQRPRRPGRLSRSRSRRCAVRRRAFPRFKGSTDEPANMRPAHLHHERPGADELLPPQAAARRRAGPVGRGLQGRQQLQRPVARLRRPTGHRRASLLQLPPTQLRRQVQARRRPARRRRVARRPRRPVRERTRLLDKAEADLAAVSARACSCKTPGGAPPARPQRRRVPESLAA